MTLILRRFSDNHENQKGESKPRGNPGHLSYSGLNVNHMTKMIIQNEKLKEHGMEVDFLRFEARFHQMDPPRIAIVKAGEKEMRIHVKFLQLKPTTP